MGNRLSKIVTRTGDAGTTGLGDGSRAAKDSLRIVAIDMNTGEHLWVIPNGDADEEDQEAIPFHAGEIWQILIAGLEYGQGDFMKTLAFIVNYGRDNDTVAAVAGIVVGAQVGFDGLPEKEREQVLQASREVIGIDLEMLAREVCGYSGKMTETILGDPPPPRD